MGNMFVKMPTLSEISGAKPAPANPAVPEPQWFFGISLRIVVLVVLAAYAIMGIVGLAQSVGFLFNPIFWFFLVLDVAGLLLDIFGLLAVLRLIPEWMVAYGWALVVLLAVDLVRCITWAILGSFASAFVTFAFQVLFTGSMIGCLLALRTYALACRGVTI